MMNKESMKHLVVGDIHGAGVEFLELLEKNTDKTPICVGDLFDRSFAGVEVWRIIQKYNIRATLGNHEKKYVDFFEGRKDWLPKHYNWFLNDMLARGESLMELYLWIKNLPLIIKLDNCMVAHGGACLDNPLRENVSFNVYGGYSPEKRMPKNVNRVRDWWNQYAATSHQLRVLYGHIQHPEPMVTHNSIGLDTAACMGGKLTGYCPEDNTFSFVESKENYFRKMEQLKVIPDARIEKFKKEVCEFISKEKVC